MGTLLVPAAGGGVGMGGVSSCGDSPSPQLGAQNQVFSQVVQWKNMPLSLPAPVPVLSDELISFQQEDEQDGSLYLCAPGTLFVRFSC